MRARRGDAVEARHLEVEHDEVRLVLGGELDRAQPVARLRDDLEVGLELEQRRERLAHEVLVVGQQQPDHVARCGARPVRTKPPAASGAASTRPPTAAKRSRRPATPLPSPSPACTRDAVVGHPHDDVVALALDRDLAALGAGVAQQVRRAFAHAASRTAAAAPTGTASGVPSTAASTPAALQDADRVGELDGEPDAPVALDELARLGQRLERQRVGVARRGARASSSSTPISRAASCALSAIACS